MGILRMCIDYTSLNKACPKDPFVLPRIDQVIDSTAGYELLCFLDAYLGYHQIRMKVDDQDKMSFIMPFRAFYYITMPFGLKNAGATYQRCIQNCLHKQIGRNVHAYVDDIIVKSQNSGDLIADLMGTFANLRKYKTKLNPTKCVFGVPTKNLLGFIVLERGIEVNSEKISRWRSYGMFGMSSDSQVVSQRLAGSSRCLARRPYRFTVSSRRWTSSSRTRKLMRLSRI
jgi:hypothetical protein